MTHEGQIQMKDLREALRQIIRESDDKWPGRNTYLRFSSIRSAMYVDPDEVLKMAQTPSQREILQDALRRIPPPPQ